MFSKIGLDLLLWPRNMLTLTYKSLNYKNIGTAWDLGLIDVSLRGILGFISKWGLEGLTRMI